MYAGSVLGARKYNFLKGGVSPDSDVLGTYVSSLTVVLVENIENEGREQRWRCGGRVEGVVDKERAVMQG